MRELLRLHLSNAGYKVLVAKDVVDAGYLFLKQLPDLILADIEMPLMDGLEFVRAVKADRTTRSVPVIFKTMWCYPRPVLGAHAARTSRA